MQHKNTFLLQQNKKKTVQKSCLAFYYSYGFGDFSIFYIKNKIKKQIDLSLCKKNKINEKLF